VGVESTSGSIASITGSAYLDMLAVKTITWDEPLAIQSRACMLLGYKSACLRLKVFATELGIEQDVTRCLEGV
jgi:hypothetical protein